MTKKIHNTRNNKSLDDWSTPWNAFYKIESFLQIKFTLDPCASREQIFGMTISHNAKCEHYFTQEENGLLQSWKDQIVFVNMPYDEKKTWLKKILFEITQKNKNDISSTIIVALMPNNADTIIFHELIMQANLIYFLQGRIHFEDPTSGKRKNNNLGSILAVFFPRKENETVKAKLDVWNWKKQPIINKGD